MTAGSGLAHIQPVICSIDTKDIETARRFAALAGRSGGMVKLGLEFFCAHGAEGVRAVLDGTNAPLFLDMKLHDIPNTVAEAVRSLAPLKPAFLTVHASGGEAMLQMAQDVAAEHDIGLLGVTVLTSLDEVDLRAVGQETPVTDQVMRLARLVAKCGLRGLVCSPHEVAKIRAVLPQDDFKLVVPGIRLEAGGDDQKRVMTPEDAMRQGASYLVVGRPITKAVDPEASYTDILKRATQW